MVLYAAGGATAADWLEAWATLGGAVLSAAAVLVAVLVVRQEQKHRRDDKREAEIAQARLVFAAPVKAIVNEADEWSGVEIIINNNSPYPIHDIEARAQTRVADCRPVAGRVSAGNVAPGQGITLAIAFFKPIPWPFSRSNITQPSALTLAGRVETSVVFVDAAGLRWLRYDRKEPQPSTTRYRPPGIPTLLVRYLRLNVPFAWFVWRRRQLRQRIFNALNMRVRRQEQNQVPPRPWLPWHYAGEDE